MNFSKKIGTLKSVSIENTFDENTEWELEVYDNIQSLKLKKQKLKGKSTTIQTASWKEGVYMVRVKYKDEVLTEKLVVKINYYLFRLFLICKSSEVVTL